MLLHYSSLILATGIMIACLLTLLRSPLRHPSRLPLLLLLCEALVKIVLMQAPQALIRMAFINSPVSPVRVSGFNTAPLIDILFCLTLLCFCAQYPGEDGTPRLASLRRGVTPLLALLAFGVITALGFVIFAHSLERAVNFTQCIAGLVAVLFFLRIFRHESSGTPGLQLRYLIFSHSIFLSGNLLLLLTAANQLLGVGSLFTTIIYTIFTSYAVISPSLRAPLALLHRVFALLSILYCSYFLFPIIVVNTSIILLKFNISHDTLFIYAFIFAGACLGVSLYPAFLIILEIFRRLTFTNKLISSSYYRQFRSAIQQAPDQATIIAQLIKAFDEFTTPYHYALYLLDTEDGAIHVSLPQRSDLWPGLALLSHELITMFAKQERALLIDLAQWYTEPQRSLGLRLRKSKIALVIPLCIDGQYRGVLFFGEKKRGKAYSEEDIAALTRFASAAIEKLAYLYHIEKLKDDSAILKQLAAQQQAQLISATQKLHHYDGYTEHFLALVSHELQTPLTVILGMAEVALDPTPGSPSAPLPDITRQAVTLILENARRQKRLVDDLLDLSRITYEKLSLRCEPADLWTLAEKSAESLQQRAAERNLQLQLYPPTEPLPIHADPLRIIQAISNLLTNALKFTDTGGTVAVNGEICRGYAVISVSDTGKGIAKEELANIFALFKQGNYQSKEIGLGIGLALVSGIVELHHGQVSAYSAGVGHGSTFRVEIPIATPRTRSASSAVVSDTVPTREGQLRV